ncbi:MULTISPECIES: hypothetical protein [Paenibacillus]|uniref:hypothetical protein n=1 Tax=Paenibacillus TaxID=44249 RepID=UPI00203B3669|nr:hypothetical protein [Paenibacillus lactis]MCM3495969.1 hypothetical protein [Paenibacillus lactis]
MKIKKKNFLSVVLATVLLSVSLQPVASAQQNVMSDPRLNEISQKYDTEFVVLSDSELEEVKQNGPLLSFTDLDEYESFLADTISELEKFDTDQNSVLEVPEKTDSTISPMAQTSTTLSWWAPFSGGLSGIFTWKNIALVYNYENNSNGLPYFTGVSKINSYISGMQVAVSWTQTTGTKTYSNTCWDKDTANFVVQGYYLIGAEINGLPIGAKINDTWNRSLQLEKPGRGCF